MKNIVYINAALGYGSTGRIVEQTALLAEKHGYHCTIVHSARYGKKSTIRSYQIGTKIAENIHALMSLLFDAQGYGSSVQTKRAIEFIENQNPDIVHIHNIHGYYINHRLLFKYLQKKNIPVVWTLHDCWPITGHCVYFDAIGCDRWKTGCFDCPQISTYPRSLIDRSSYNYKQKKYLFSSIENLTMVPVSKWIADLTRESYLGNKTIQTIHNGIDITVFKPRKTNIRNKFGFNEDDFVVLGVANHFGSRKGLDDFIRLYYCKSPDIKILLVGASEKEIKKLPNGIFAIPKTESQEELANIYSMADVFVNPTYEDNFPTTNIESLACGTPVITYNTGGCAEAIDNKTGIVVPKGNLCSLVNAIHLIKDNGKRSYFKFCRERAVNKFNKDERFMDYIKLYNDLLKGCS